jgi:NADH dehydrogenase
MKKGVIIIPGSGKYRLQPISVEDVTKIILEAVLEKKFSNKILDLVGPQKISFEDYVRLFSKNTKVELKKINLENAYDDGTYGSEFLDILIGDYTSDVKQIQKLIDIKLTAVESFLQSSTLS